MPEQTDETATPKQYNDPISVAKRTKQKIHLVSQIDKPAMLEHLVKASDRAQTVVIVKTKRSADMLSRYLQDKGIKALAIHGNKSSELCEEGVKAFNEAEANVLITMDAVLQSLAFTQIERIVGYDLPIEPEHYLYRLGCLSEAGEAVSFVSEEEETFLFLIERTMRQEIPQEELEGFVATVEEESVQTIRSQKKKPRHRKQKSKKKENRDASQSEE